MATQTIAPSRAGKYVTFHISRHYYAIEARRIRLVALGKDIVPIHHPLPFVCGALAIRGRLVPVVDLREKLGHGHRGSPSNASVLLIEPSDVCGLPLIGIVVDRLTDVVELRNRDFHDNVIQMRNDGRPYGRPKTLLDVESLLTLNELMSLRSIF